MKTKTLKIFFQSWEGFKARSTAELKNVAENGEKYIQPRDVLFFDSVTSYQRLMGEQKYILLAAIKNLKPSSIYKLAKLVGRDFANVKKDCETLEAAGFIVLEENDDNRGTKTPKLSFDYVAIEIHVSNLRYRHNLDDSAA
jgi:predicted transcriptional regulator